MDWVLPVLTTERLRLRAVTMEDAEALFAYGSNPQVTQYVLWETHQTLDDAKGFIDMILDAYETRGLYLWGIEYEGKFIGTIDYVGLNDYSKIGEIGYVLSEDYWNKGIITEAAKRIIDFGFTELGLVRIQARCIAENMASSRVMEKSGMILEGTHRKSLFAKGRHYDVHMYAIIDYDRG
ncbi:GNAT family N-acetyltransferase [Lysinibacillus sp. LZ02]|uniref:GNAT family N-acetyltransferase n=1 Tax=Lysinibacillus sp. LZ02 TaxID=3420668 RepID=UPI003D35B5AA